MTNGGGISLASGFQLRLASGTLANSDYINLNAATVAGSGLLDNAGGVVTGPAPPSAFSELGRASRAARPDERHAAFASTGAIVLGGVGATLSGGSISNTGFIEAPGSCPAR